MSTLHDLTGKSDPKNDRPDPSAPAFSELDLEKIKDSLDLAKEGKERGKKNIPPSKSEALDDVEHKVVATIEAEHRRQQQAFNEQLKIHQQRVAQLDIEHEAINIASAAQRASTEFVVKVDEGKAKLFTL